MKWFIPEIHSSDAARLLEGRHELLATDMLLPESSDLISRKACLGELTLEDCKEVFTAIQSAPVSTYPSQNLLEGALEITVGLDRPLSDGLNLALAVQQDCRLVTAKKGLFESLQGTPFSVHVKWVGDVR
jgi:predicted nucleic acid-binding protein